MKRKKNIRKIVTRVVLGVLLPVNLVSFLAYGLIYRYIRSDLIETQETALTHYAELTEMGLDSTSEYMLQFLFGQEWGDLLGKRGDASYEMTKVRLRNNLDWRIQERYQGNADLYFFHLKNSGESIYTYNRNILSLEEADVLKEWSQTAESANWTLLEINNRQYLYYGSETAFLFMGALVDTEKLNSSLGAGEEFTLSLTGTEELSERRNERDLTIRVPMLDGGLTLTMQIPDSYMGSAMPIQLSVLLLSLLASFGMAALLVVVLNRFLAEPLEEMTGTIHRIQEGDRELRLETDGSIQEIGEVQKSFNTLMDQIYHLEVSNYEKEIENQKAQLMNLQLQINPHLLLNTLNTIYGLAEIEEYENIQSFTMNLVKYFRYSLKQTDEPVSIRQELDFVKCYVEVQKIRYPDAFSIIYNYEEDVEEEKIPPLLIQNFVENSIKYSIGRKIVEIVVVVRRDGDWLNVSVCDDGVGIAPETLEVLRKGETYVKNGETHVGIYNCIRRMRLFYGERAQISITSEPGAGTQVWMKIPREEEEQNESVDH